MAEIRPFAGIRYRDADLSRVLAPPYDVITPAYRDELYARASSFGDWLMREGRLKPDQLECLSDGFRLYWQRCSVLHARAPGSWFPPRRTNLLIAPEPRGILPYLEPFRGTSSLLYSSDLDTNPEYLAALIVHMERLALLRSPPATITFNLSYWFDRDSSSRTAFDDAARRSTRPDAAAFVALADAFNWVDELLHEPLRLPPRELTEPYLRIDGADLYVPKRLQPQLVALGAAVEASVRTAFEVTAPTVRTTGSHTLDELCDWLVSSRAHVIVHGPHGGGAVPSGSPTGARLTPLGRALLLEFRKIEGEPRAVLAHRQRRLGASSLDSRDPARPEARLRDGAPVGKKKSSRFQGGCSNSRRVFR